VTYFPRGGLVLGHTPGRKGGYKKNRESDGSGDRSWGVSTRRDRSIAPPEAGCKGIRTATLKPLTSLTDSPSRAAACAAFGRMHRHLAWGFGEGDQRRPVTGDPPDVQVAMSPRAREPGVQFLALLTAESAMNQTRKLALTVLRKAC
jgi:hypothetical protein